MSRPSASPIAPPELEDEDEEEPDRSWLKLPYEVRLSVVQAGLARLQQQIREACGPEHEYLKLRDDRPPTCPRCQYTDGGLHIRDFGPGVGHWRRDE